MAKRVLILGAGGVGNVVVRKCAMAPEVFGSIVLASRTRAKCDAIAADIGGGRVQTAGVDADRPEEMVALIRDVRPSLVVNVALPYQDLAVMDACLATGVDYLDTANYEPPDVPRFEYRWQWAYRERFEAAGIMALLGCGFDPGVTGVFTAHAAKHHFDEVRYLDIVDCNAGSHGRAFATNFNPEINIREITARGRYWQDGSWVETEPLEIHRPVTYPGIGPRESYLLYHEELESLAVHFPTLRRARFWMTFGEEYLTHLRVLQNVGMTSIQPVRIQGVDIQPLQFLKAVLPDPASLAAGYTGQTSIGCQIRGVKGGRERTCYVYNNCDHAACYREVKAQAVSYTTGVPAMIGAMLMLQGVWHRPGVWNVEQLDPDPFMAALPRQGLPWHEEIDQPLAFDDVPA
ncbi:MAG: saccharopine dehydrogenase family protein [Lentisphaeria bacterium]|nr:saccharopine dehydrogenase family protein [Lentisphaeria bacterium]